MQAAALERFDNARVIDGVEPTRTSNATLISGKSTPVSRSELSALPTPEATDSHKPVAHSELVRTIELVLGENGIYIEREAYSVNRQGNALFGVMDLRPRPEISWPTLNGFAAALGLRTANDKSMSIQLGVGAKVFICDNLAFHADMIALKRKHTSGLDLMSEIKRAIEKYIEKFWKMSLQFDDMKNIRLTDTEAKIRIYDIFAKGMLAPRYFPSVNAAYFALPEAFDVPEDALVPFGKEYSGTLWALHNAFTWALKSASLPVQQTATIELAREFALTA